MAWRENPTFGKGTKIEQLVSLVSEFTIGTEAANVINVAIQLVGGVYGRDVDRAMCLKWYLSSDSAGQVLEATGPDAIAIGTDGMLMKSGGDSVVQGDLTFETDGDADLDITKSGADTFYLNLVMPDGNILTSDAITFDATT